mmetsp:Transcript_131443/g.227619  ORF Transcript_131443/g.227619 Transcript_131443/m.227619 type:complete len:240 (-) Transcript_131443:1534-2253(-)
MDQFLLHLMVLPFSAGDSMTVYINGRVGLSFHFLQLPLSILLLSLSMLHFCVCFLHFVFHLLQPFLRHFKLTAHMLLYCLCLMHLTHHLLLHFLQQLFPLVLVILAVEHSCLHTLHFTGPLFLRFQQLLPYILLPGFEIHLRLHDTQLLFHFLALILSADHFLFVDLILLHSVPQLLLHFLQHPLCILLLTLSTEHACICLLHFALHLDYPFMYLLLMFAAHLLQYILQLLFPLLQNPL